MFDALHLLAIIAFAVIASLLVSMITAINSAWDSRKIHKQLSAMEEKLRILETAGEMRGLSESTIRAR